MYVKQIGNLLENIQLVDPTAIMHAAVETDNSKPISKKEEMNANMTIFLAYAPVGKDRNAFKQKKNNNKKKGRRGKDEPDTLDPSMYPTLVFSSDGDPETIISRVMHEFCCTGGFYFCKKQLQCMLTVTPFIIYYLYTFNDIATLRRELTDLLKKAHQDLESNFMVRRSLSTQKSRVSTPAEVSQSFLISQDLNFGNTQGRCRKHNGLILLNAMCRRFHSSDS